MMTNDQRATYTIGATLTLTSPLMIAGTGTQRLNVETLEFVSTKENSTPCSRVQTLALVAPETGMIHRRVPVIAANNIAGRLRRHGARIVLDELAAKGQKVSIGTYSGLMCGAISGNPGVEDVEFEEYRKSLDHPYMGLFGGGPRWLRRNLRVHNALPDLPETRSLIADMCIMRTPGAVPAGAVDSEAAGAVRSARSLLGYWVMNRNDDLNDLVDISRASEHIEDFRNAMAQRQQKILAEKQERKGNENSTAPRDIAKTESFSAIEFVVPGVTFMLQFELMDVTPAQLGLFLESLDSFARTERLGCMTRNGFGRFKLSDLIIETHAGASTRQHVVQTEILSDLSTLVSNPGLRPSWVAPVLSQWEQAKESMTSDELEFLFRPGKRSEKGRKKKTEAQTTSSEPTEQKESA